ncbi:HAD-IA family hydrolase [Candidatus Dependentiae bacterium]|nr:HAD-IA family hydrolase [Candidatus Dependentiae bacterium]
MKKLVLYGLLMSGSCSRAESPKVLIWDLGGVLLCNSKLTYVCSIGFKPIISYVLTERTAPWKFSATIQKRLFEVLHTICVEDHAIGKGSCIPGGIIMPPVLWAFQAGLLDASECIKRSKEALQSLQIKGHFKNFQEKELIERIICATFTPALSVSSCSLRTETMKIVRELASQRYPDGTKKYTLLVLSNWDPWSFVGIRKKFSIELSYFDDVIISGDINLMKPMHQIFKYILEKHNVSREDCIFIDDQFENIKGALSFGIKHPLHFQGARGLRQQLRRLKVL